MGEYYEEEGGSNIYAVMIYLSAAFFLISVILKWLQLDTYVIR